MNKWILSIVAGVCMVAVAQEQPDREAPKGRPENGRPENGRPERAERGKPANIDQMIERLEREQKEVFAKYDKDQDGKLSEEERKQADEELNVSELQKKMRMARSYNLFKRLDTNGDGVISAEEKEAASKAMKEGRNGRGGEGRGPRPQKKDGKNKKKPRNEDAE